MTTLRYLPGDATTPERSTLPSCGPRPLIIAHICNDLGAWGAGFVLALSKRWASPENSYHHWRERGYFTETPRVRPPLITLEPRVPFELGQVQFVEVERRLFVANMVAQSGLGQMDPERPPLRYDALDTCLRSVAVMALSMLAEVAMPKIGSGLAGGSWPRIEALITANLIANEVPTTVYLWPEDNQ